MPRVTPRAGLAAALQDIRLDAVSGPAIRLGDLWVEQPAVVVHLRHFGWLFCRAHVAQLRDHAPDVRDRGAVLAAIGTGDLPYARELAARLRIDFPLLVDPRLRSYGVAGTRRASPLRVLDPRQAVAAALHLVGDRVRQGRTGPHPFQLGATHIMLPSGDVPFAWVNTDFSDNAPPAEVIAALDG